VKTREDESDKIFALIKGDQIKGEAVPITSRFFQTPKLYLIAEYYRCIVWRKPRLYHGAWDVGGGVGPRPPIFGMVSRHNLVYPLYALQVADSGPT
jgi:hypothetical protein